MSTDYPTLVSALDALQGRERHITYLDGGGPVVRRVAAAPEGAELTLAVESISLWLGCSGSDLTSVLLLLLQP